MRGNTCPILISFGLLLGSSACFNEDADTTAAGNESSTETETTDDPTDDPTDEPTETTTDPATDTDPTDTEPTDTEPTETDTEEDLPPTVELSVNGANMPPVIEVSQAVALTAEAMDDMGIDRVDFYLDNTLVGSDDSEPYEATALLTSLDNGPHSFRAQAYDSANQSAEDEVDVAVSITGGAELASDGTLFQMGGIIFHPGLGLVLMPDDSVTILGSLTVGVFDFVGLGAINFTAELDNINWQLSVPEALVEGEQQWLTFGKPVLGMGGERIWIAGNRMSENGVIQNNINLMAVASNGSQPLPFLEFETSDMEQNIAIGGMDVNLDGDLFMAGPDTLISKLDNNGLIWQSDVGLPWTISEFGGVNIQGDRSGGAIFDAYTCNGPCELTTSRINGFDGNELWSDSVPAASNFFMFVGASAVSPDNEVVTFNGPSIDNGGGLKMTLRDEDGALLEAATIGELGDTYFVSDVAFEPQGTMVVSGGFSTEDQPNQVTPFVARVSREGDLLWEESLSFGNSPDIAVDLEVDREGRVYVLGISSITPTFLAFVGDAWIARLSL